MIKVNQTNKEKRPRKQKPAKTTHKRKRPAGYNDWNYQIQTIKTTKIIGDYKNKIVKT